ncbi:MAG: PhzF family phenazine biosynthesis protein [Pseudomonadota bacterium]
MNNTLTFTIVDVFTRERFAGNPLAVFHDARNLDPVQMQQIAREFGFSETAFILPSRRPEHHAQVRIFTPLEEIPFAGHPNIGAAFVMANHDTAAAGALPETALFDEMCGDVRITALREANAVTGAELEVPQPVQKLGDIPARVVARCLGLAVTAISTRRIEPCIASVGLPFAFAELANLDALGGITPDVAAFREAAGGAARTVDGFAICAFVVLENAGELFEIRSRVLSPLGHPAEDPATGSAAAALGGLLVEASARASGKIRITQGVEIGRPGDIMVEVPPKGAPIRLRGHCVHVATGTLGV